MKFQYFILIFLFFNCQTNMNKKINVPICKAQNKILTAHNDSRTDPYYWLNDRKNPKVIEYLKEENKYTDVQMEPTNEFQKKLFFELKSRIKEDDESVPYLYNGFHYWKRFYKK